METVSVVVILAAVLGGAIAYIYKAKKSGIKCIGCPDGASCGKNTNQCACCSGKCSGCSSKNN